MNKTEMVMVSVPRELFKVASCPCCDGSGGFYDGDGEACQCQWCFERNAILAQPGADEQAEQQPVAWDVFVERAAQILDAEQRRLSAEDYLMDSDDCIKVLRETVAALSQQTDPDECFCHTGNASLLHPCPVHPVDVEIEAKQATDAAPIAQAAPLRYTNDGSLAECPCCGSLDVGGAHDTVFCHRCGLTVTKPRPLQNAIDAWNMRAGCKQPDKAQPDARTLSDIQAVLMEMRERRINHGKNTSPTLIEWEDRIEAALAGKGCAQ